MALKQAKIADLYSGIDFDPYTFREYPKEITLPNEKRVIVDNRKHELDTMMNFNDSAPVSSKDQERNELAEALAKEQAEKADLQRQLDKLLKDSGATVSAPIKTDADDATPSDAPKAKGNTKESGANKPDAEPAPKGEGDGVKDSPTVKSAGDKTAADSPNDLGQKPGSRPAAAPEVPSSQKTSVNK